MKVYDIKMRGNTIAKKSRTRDIVTIVACVFVGLTLLISGTGKLLEFGMILVKPQNSLGLYFRMHCLHQPQCFLYTIYLFPTLSQYSN